MARTGRPRKPTHLKLLEGTFRKDRAPKREPKAPKGSKRMSPPAYLGREAKIEWRRVIALIDDMGILSSADRSIIAAYCQACHRLAQYEADIDQNGSYIITEKGYECQRPSVAMAQKQAQLMRSLAGELGLSPAARSRVEFPEKPPEKDKTEELLFGPRRNPSADPFAG